MRASTLILACPWCGRPFAEDLTPYTLDRDQELVVFCSRCGAEIALPDEVDDV